MSMWWFITTLAITAFISNSPVYAYDNNPLQDICVAVNDSHASVFANRKICKDPKLATTDDFFFSGLNVSGNPTTLFGFAATRVDVTTMPGLNTLDLPPPIILTNADTIRHTHDTVSSGCAPTKSAIQAIRIKGSSAAYLVSLPATALITVLEGTVYTGFLVPDPANFFKSRLISKILNLGDVFLIPQPAAAQLSTATGRPPFEAVQPAPPPQTITYATLFNSNTINSKQSALINSKTIAKSIEIIHGGPTIMFSMEERQDFMIEERLHQAVVFKLSHGAPDLKVLRSILPKHLGTKGNCLIGLLAPRQILLRFDQYEDYVLALSRSVNYLLYNGEKHQCRIFPWSIGYNPTEETTLAVVWISLPNLSPDLFVKKSLLSIASAVGKPIAIDKATQIKSRPSTARVKVILDLMEKLPNRIRLQFVDEKICWRLILKRNQNNKQIDDTIEVATKGTIDSEKYQGDAREILNEKRKVVDVDQSKATSLDRQLVVVTSEQNRAHSMDVVTSNIGVQKTTKNKGGMPRVGVDAPRVGSGKKIMDSGHKLMDTSDVEDAENSGQHVLQVETKNATKNWILVPHKNSTSNRSLSPTSQNNSPCSEKGATENFHDSEKRQDISIASRDLLCSNSFDALSKTTGKQVKLTENDNDLIQEKQISPPTLKSKLSPEAPVFVPKCVIAKKNKSRALVSNTIDLGEDSLDEDEEGNMLDLGEDSLDEDEEDMLDICFDRVAREGNISPRQQRSGSNKNKKKTHGRQHSWDDKMTEEFVSRHLPMR
ncbi:hypothetical protein MTR67_004065 [Solanum verrucosum]|uniref:DUF4283 domain-containing protein n=1 Tax=Solanum verrucosum TaxID=315347 RepID=A0AAF0PWV6_SOLVR|nr:hypothetical protein MTR67_004065 [Solanum verrucosum]